MIPFASKIDFFSLNPNPARSPPSFQLGLGCFGCRPINDPIKFLPAMPWKDRLTT
jgi:hypothetical protein